MNAPSSSPTLRITLVVASGFAMMIACMGIGRFAYTPLLPAMQQQFNWSLAQAGDVAAANFLGYLVGALLAAQLSQGRHRGYALMVGLLGSAFTTLWGALLSGAPMPAVPALGLGAQNLMQSLSPAALLLAWMGLRLASGVFSAFCLVIGTPILMERLTQLGAGQSRLLSGAHFSGVGAGMLLTVGLIELWPAPAAAGAPLARHWALLGIASCALMIAPLAWLAGPARHAARVHPTQAAAPAQTAPFKPSRPLLRLILAYGLMGYGYVVTATFIVAMARRLGEPHWEAWSWVAVGLAGIPSIPLWQMLADRIGMQRALRLAYAGLILGVLCAGLGKGAALLLPGAVLLGGTFMAITSMGLQAAKAMAGEHAGKAMGWMTAAFGLGQWLGPAVSGRIAQSSGDFLWPSLLAAALLVMAMLLLREAPKP